MKDFLAWCNKRNLPLPAIGESATQRQGLSQEYPAGYVRSQYPDAYFAPITATAYLDLLNARKLDKKMGVKRKMRT